MSEREPLRERPSHRFAGDEHLIDLREASEKLGAEAPREPASHQQVSLLRDGPVSLILLRFEAGAEMKGHQAEGLVAMHVVSGAITVSTPSAVHELGPGQILVLKSGVPHGLRASAASEMLLSIHLDEKPAT